MIRCTQVIIFVFCTPVIIIGDLFVFLGTSDNFWMRSICVLEILTLFVNIVRN